MFARLSLDVDRLLFYMCVNCGLVVYCIIPWIAYEMKSVALHMYTNSNVLQMESAIGWQGRGSIEI